jgi:hypothetical protein
MKRIGIIGLDTSHAPELARFFNAGPGAGVGRVTTAWPGGSSDAPLSIDRVAGFTRQVTEEFGVELAATPEDVAARCDALLLLAMDGRSHAELFARIAPSRCPVFINKPLTTSVEGAEAIAAAAARHGVRWFSASALRWAWSAGQVARSVSVACPLWFEPANAGWFWYGVHGVELMQTALGPGIVSLRVEVAAERETLHARWRDGRTAEVVGVLKKDAPFALGVDGGAPQPITVTMQPLSGAIAEFFAGGDAPVEPAAMQEAVEVLAAANLSRTRGARKSRCPRPLRPSQAAPPGARYFPTP